MRWRYLVVCVALIVPSTAIGGEGEHFIEAYNELAGMLISRCAVVGVSTNDILFKNTAWPSRSSVAQSDMLFLRDRTKTLLGKFIATPVQEGPWSLDDALLRKGFMTMEEKDGVTFLVIPAAYTQDGTAVYSETFSGNWNEVPVLWEQFAAIHERLVAMRYTLAPAGWSPEGVANKREYTARHGIWQAACDEAVQGFMAATPVSSMGVPCAYTSGYWSDEFGADVVAIGSFARVTGLRNYPGIVTFYAYARLVNGTGEWSSQGVDGCRQNLWTAFGSAPASGGAATSSLFGPDAGHPSSDWDWCLMPVVGGGNNRTTKGWDAPICVCLVEWTGIDGDALRKPDINDPEEDGLVDNDCSCPSQCEPRPRASWRGPAGGPSTQIPLGVSSGSQNGGLRVHAYLTEYDSGGQPRQMLNLGTYLRTYNDASGNWGFALVKRPSGAEVLFTLKGPRAGNPVNVNADYRLVQSNGVWELHFGGEKQVVHRYGGAPYSGVSGVSEVDQVRMRADHQEISADRGITSTGSERFLRWPGLIAVKTRGDEFYLRRVVSSVFANAAVTYDGTWIQSVSYRAPGNVTIGGVGISPRGRVYTVTDAAGATNEVVRVTVDGDRSAIELSDATGSVAERRERNSAYDEIARELTITNTVTLNPGMPDEVRHVDQRWFDTVDGNLLLVREEEGAGGDEPQTTSYSYYTNPAETGRHGRVSLVTRPDGSWTRVDYDSEGRETVVLEPFEDSPTDAPAEECRATYYIYAGDPVLDGLEFPADDVSAPNDRRPRLVIREALGCEVARTHHAYPGDRHEERRSRTPGAFWTDPDNQVAITRRNTTGDFTGHPATAARADATFSTYAYTYDAVTKVLTTTERTGEGSEFSVTAGTERVTRRDAAGRALSVVESDIESGIAIRHVEYEHDAFGRVTAELDVLCGDRVDYEYGCCGVERARDAEGIETYREYTPLRQVSASTRLGVTTRSRYDSRGNAVETRTCAEGEVDAVSHAVFDWAGRQTALTNALGYTTTWQYEATPQGGSQTTITLPDGATRVESTYRDGRIKSIGGTAESPVFYDYGAEEGLQWEIVYRGVDTNATEWIKTYNDMLGRTVRVEHPDGYTRQTEFDENGRSWRVSDGFVTNLITYTARGEPLRRAVDMDADEAIDVAGDDRIVETAVRYVRVNGSDVRENETRTYPESGSAMTAVDSVVRTALNGLEMWTVSYGRTNHASVVHDRASGTRIETVTRPDGTQRVLSYTNGLLVASETRDSMGGVVAVTAKEYDGFMRLRAVSERAPNGEERITSYAYDAAGQVTGTVVRAGGMVRVTAYEYDAVGRMVRTVLPDGGEVLRAYDAQGNLVEKRGARTYPVRYEYDEQGRRASLATHREGLDGPADRTTWSYDPQRGWLTRKTYADGTYVTYETYGNGALESRAWARGVETRYGYDAAGELAEVRYSDATPDVDYVRDRRGRVVEVRDGAGVWTQVYTHDGHMVSQSLPHVGDGVLVWGRDGLGRLTNVVFTVAAGEIGHATGYGYDVAGRLASVAAGDINAVYAFGADGVTVTNLTYGHGLRVGWRYDALGRLWNIESVTDGGRVLRRDEYGYDGADRRVSREREDGSRWDYGYDVLGHVISARRCFADGVPAGGCWQEYAYDTIGNRCSAQTVIGRKTRMGTYTANTLNQYTGRTVPGQVLVTGMAHTGAVITVRADAEGAERLANRHKEYFWRAVMVTNDAVPFASTNLTVTARLTRKEGSVTNTFVRVDTRKTMLPASPEAFSYDADGNLISDGLRTYTWDAENRLIAVESDPGLPAEMRRRSEYAYDAQSRRLHATHYVWHSASDQFQVSGDHTFVYDGWNLIAEQVDTTSSSRTNYYTWGLDLSGTPQGAGGIGGLLAVSLPPNETNPLLIPLYDGIGNITALADTSGVLVAEYEYDAFGKLLRQSGPYAAANPFRFSTKYQDSAHHLIYYGYRWYNPELGRWLNRDPLEEEGGINLYSFVDNNSVNVVDPLGLALYAFDGTWNDRDKMKRPTNVAKLVEIYNGAAWYEKGVGTDWYTKHIGGLTGVGGKNRIESMYGKLTEYYNTPDPTGENQQIDIIGFSRGAALARTFVNYINSKGGVPLLGPDGRPTGVVCPVRIRFLGLFDTVASFGLPGNNINWGQNLSIPENVDFVRHAVALDEKREMFPLSSALSGPRHPRSDPRIVERGFVGAHSDIGGGYEEGDRSNFALMWMRNEGGRLGVPFGPLSPEDTGARNPIVHDERDWRERLRNWPRKIYY